MYLAGPALDCLAAHWGMCSEVSSLPWSDQPGRSRQNGTGMIESRRDRQAPNTTMPDIAIAQIPLVRSTPLTTGSLPPYQTIHIPAIHSRVESWETSIASGPASPSREIEAKAKFGLEVSRVT